MESQSFNCSVAWGAMGRPASRAPLGLWAEGVVGRLTGRGPLGLWAKGAAGRPVARALLGFFQVGCCMELRSEVELASAGQVASTTRSLAFVFSF